MKKVSWRFNLILLIVLLLSVSLFFHLFYVIPYIQSEQMSKERSHQENTAHNVAVFLKTKIEESGLVLIVDDDAAFGGTLTDVLKEKGYRVATARSGEEALDVVRENGFDVIFIDVRMPVMNGLEVYLAMKKIKPDVKAVMMTGFRREVGDIVDQAISVIAYTCLDKPIDLNILLKVVDAVASGRPKAEVQEIVSAH